ncbi:hypothetical protein BO70DRAFT_336703 [Aspergillus heteromorphus CBS 117.55]|uniref:UBX domain-containing protein n=1 Tax=Aspergillus heteromorphus CBS 117.55 TaxID=1448321 RepID=A0A317W6K7_9EURO|nr:uncharacterized protein BO70DRAFT_336703 [Aspergillus heteromorphus CBS 117.55]PWY82254.1 hypothetical protein BO70DRAFT_336703 [Aspergillus heteromorphus CBS 117.55]
MFYEGSLEDGIKSAVEDEKIVVCFVRDDGPLSDEWEAGHFKFLENSVRYLLTRAVVLRLTKDSEEAGFLDSFCPIEKAPAVVVIKDGMLCEYFGPDTEREDFRHRLVEKLIEDDPDGRPLAVKPRPVQPAPPVDSDSEEDGYRFPVPVDIQLALLGPPESIPDNSIPADSPVAALPYSMSRIPESRFKKPRDKRTREGKRRDKDTRASEPEKPQDQKPEPSKQSPKPSIEVEPASPSAPKPTEPTEVPSSTRSSPNQYRLQVRLFDGRSVRGSFTPTQTIRADVRPWLETQMEDEKHPFNLKHIITPLPSRTITIAEEERTLEDLGLGSTATLVMVPIQSYTEAYAGSAASLPARAASSAYGLVSSAVGTATGLVGSLFGYGPAPPANEAAPSTSASRSTSADGGSRPRPSGSRGPVIRTLSDQRNERDDKQFYNGNQLNFQPRHDSDRR